LDLGGRGWVRGWVGGREDGGCRGEQGTRRKIP